MIVKCSSFQLVHYHAEWLLNQAEERVGNATVSRSEIRRSVYTNALMSSKKVLDFLAHS
jgi:hypothetical protein